MVTNEPRFKVVVFGDGLQALLLSYKRGNQTRDGVPVISCRIRPTEELVTHYGLDPNKDLNREDMSIDVQYPENQFLVLNDDPYVGTVLIMCNFLGENTRLTDLYSNLLYSSEGLHKVIKVLRAENAYLHEQLRLITSQEEKHIAETVRKILPVMKLRGESATQVDTTYYPTSDQDAGDQK